MRYGLSVGLLLVAATAARAAGDVATTAEAIEPLAVGSSIPKLTLKSASGEPFDLNAAIAKQAAVMVFYRGGW